MPRLFLVFSFFFFVLGSPLYAKSPLNGRAIVIDPGHGVINFEGKIINSGKVNHQGVTEHHLNMEISQRLGKILQEEGAKVIYTRTPFDYWRQSFSPAEDNRARAYFANQMKGEAYISIHCDWDPRPRISGVTTIYERPDARRLGELIQKRLVKNLKAKNRKLVRDSFTILDHTEMPAVIIETGFMSNRGESKKLKSVAYQLKIANCIADALRVFFREL